MAYCRLCHLEGGSVEVCNETINGDAEKTGGEGGA